MSYQLLISLPIAVSNPCRIILSLRFISSTLIFFKITVSYFTKKKGAISSFYLLLTLEIAFVLFCILTFVTFPTSTSYFLSQREKKYITYFCPLFLSLQNLFPFSLSHLTKVFQISLLERRLFTYLYRLENSRKKLSIVCTIGQMPGFYL